MESYIKLKNEMVNLQSELGKIQNDKNSIIKPLYEIENKYKYFLEGCLPKNMHSSTMDLRITVLEEEVKSLRISEQEKEETLKTIEDIKEKIRLNKERAQKIEEEIKIKSPFLERRRNYVLEKIQEKETIENDISKTEKRISELNNFSVERDWELAICNAINEVIKDYVEKRDYKISLLSKILEDEKLISDMELLTGKKQKAEEDKIVDETEKQSDKNEKANSNIKVEKVPEEKKENIIIAQKEQSIEVDKLPEEKNNEIKTEVYYNFDFVEVESEQEEQKENNEKQISVISSFKNWILEQKIKLKKTRIALGISSILNNVDEDEDINEEEIENSVTTNPEEAFLKSNLLISKTKKIIDDACIYKEIPLLQEEVNYIARIAKLIKNKKEEIILNNEYSEEQIMKLEKLNQDLENYIENIRNRLGDLGISLDDTITRDLNTKKRIK